MEVLAGRGSQESIDACQADFEVRECRHGPDEHAVFPLIVHLEHLFPKGVLKGHILVLHQHGPGPRKPSVPRDCPGQDRGTRTQDVHSNGHCLTVKDSGNMSTKTRPPLASPTGLLRARLARKATAPPQTGQGHTPLVVGAQQNLVPQQKRQWTTALKLLSTIAIVIVALVSIALLVEMLLSHRLRNPIIDAVEKHHHIAFWILTVLSGLVLILTLTVLVQTRRLRLKFTWRKAILRLMLLAVILGCGIVGLILGNRPIITYIAGGAGILLLLTLIPAAGSTERATSKPLPDIDDIEKNDSNASMSKASMSKASMLTDNGANDDDDDDSQAQSQAQ